MTTINIGSTSPANTVPSTAATATSRGAEAANTQASAAEPSLTEVHQAANKIKDTVQAMASNLAFSVDQSSGRTVVKVTDVQTGETIRQIPSKEVLELANDITRMQGLLLKKQTA